MQRGQAQQLRPMEQPSLLSGSNSSSLPATTTTAIQNDVSRQATNDDRILCPCQDFAALSKIVDTVLADEEKTAAMIDWLNGDTDQRAVAQHKVLSCGKRSQCRFRYGTSFAVLDAIRDACTPFLVNNEVDATKTTVTPTKPSYEAAFPPLKSVAVAAAPHPAMSNILVPPTQGVEKQIGFGNNNGSGAMASSINTLPTRKKNKSKRRIRPQLTTAPKTPAKPFATDEESQLPIPAPEPPVVIQPSVSTVPAPQPVVATPTKTTTATIQQQSPLNELPLEHLDRLATIYVALIQNLLVPSTPVQLNLLLQLLDAKSAALQPTNDEQQTILFFQPLFSSASRCVHFAQRVLTDLYEPLLQHLPAVALRSLVQWDRFQEKLPSVGDKLKQKLEAWEAEYKSPQISSSVNAHAILSLPFERDRDSRHNYKTAAEIALYKNREQTRDAFLSQLRAYMTAKSKVFLTQDADKIREKAQTDSRRILGNIFNANMVWFAQFFCDLLLQVGHSPVEEMDQELLSIVQDDRDKLQKLHKRMSRKSSGPQASSNGNRTATSARGASVNHGARRQNGKKAANSGAAMAPLQDALEYFPDYQEFFLVFLYSVDSHRFGISLSQQLSQAIQNAVSDRSTAGFEKRLMDLQLLGRFLGVLVFGPYWHGERLDWTTLKPLPIAPDFALKQLETLNLPISKLVMDAWKGRYISLAVPCVAEMLKMSTWDSMSQTSRPFRQLLSDLRGIQKHIWSKYRETDANLRLVSFHLEALFNDCIGLPRLTSLPPSTIDETPQICVDDGSLDVSRLILSGTAVYASSPHMELVTEMLLSRIQKKSLPSRRTSSNIKKLRPSIVGAVLGDSEVQSYVGMESPRGKMLSPDGKKQAVKETPDDKRRGAQKRLEDSFFHQHGNLKAICDFAVDQTLKYISPQTVLPFIRQAINEQNTENHFSESRFDEIHKRAMHLSREDARRCLSEKVSTSIQLLGPSDLHPVTIQMAVNLSVTRGLESCHGLLVTMLNSLVHTAIEEHEKALKQNEITTGASDADRVVEEAAKALIDLHDNFSLLEVPSDRIAMDKCLKCVTALADSVLIPSDAALRRLFESILSLESLMKELIKTTTKTPSDGVWDLFLQFLCLATQLSRVSVHFAGRITSMFQGDFDGVVNQCKSVPKDGRSDLLMKIVANEDSKDTRAVNGQSKTELSGYMEPRIIHFQ